MEGRTTNGVSPLPGGEPLRFEVACRTNKRSRGKQHEVSIAADWTVNTGHDLEAERVAAAFGGYLSCIDVVDRLVPAFRLGLQLLLRRTPPSIRREPQGWAVTDRVKGCSCSKARTRMTRSMQDAGVAAAHERSAYHLARRFRAKEEQLQELLDTARGAYGALVRMPANREAEACIIEQFGLVELWEAGIHPDRILEIHRLLWPEERGIPARLYLAYGTYLDASEWGPWSRMGLPALDIEQLLQSPFAPEDVQAIADATYRTPRQMGVLLAAWLRASCVPEPGDLQELLALPGRDWRVPPSRAIDLVQSKVSGLGATRTQVGLVLAVTGTTVHAIRAIRQGARGPKDAYRYLSMEGLI